MLTKSLSNKYWFGAKCIFLHKKIQSRRSKRIFKERVIIVQSKDFGGAIKKAEKEAITYAQGLRGCAYVGFVNAYKIYDKKINEFSEIYSLMRESRMSVDNYLNRFHDTGMEKTTHFRQEEKH